MGVELFSICGVMTRAIMWWDLMQNAGDVCRRCDVLSEYRPKHVAENTVNKTDHNIKVNLFVIVEQIQYDEYFVVKR